MFMCSTFYLVGHLVSPAQGVVLPSLAFGTGCFCLYHKKASMDGENISIKQFIAPILKSPWNVYPNISLCLQVYQWLTCPIKPWNFLLSFVCKNFWIIWCWFAVISNHLHIFSAVFCVLTSGSVSVSPHCCSQRCFGCLSLPVFQANETSGPKVQAALHSEHTSDGQREMWHLPMSPHTLREWHGNCSYGVIPTCNSCL